MIISTKVKFILIAMAFLLAAGIAMLCVAIALGWDIIGGLTHPVAIICYVLFGVGAISIGAYLINKKMREG